MSSRNLVASGLLDALRVGVLLTDSRGRPTRANTAAQRLLGCRADGTRAPRAVLALAEAAQRTQAACQQQLLVGQTTVQVHAVPVEGGALLELEDASPAQHLQQAYRDLLAAIGEELLARVEPLGLLVEVLAGAADPTEAARILARLRGDAGALVEVLGVPEAPVVPRPAQVNDADGQAGEPAWVAQPLPRGVLDRPTVLLVHQAEGLLEALAIGLSQAGLRVIAARDLHQALEIAQTVTLEVVVLGCGHGGLTASDAHSKLRTVTAAPMVLLDATPDKLAELGGRGLGGVVVLPRPLRFADLVAAVRQQLTAHVTAPQAVGSEVLAVGEVILDEQAHAVRVRGVPVEMPIKEFELLRVLLAHAGRAISRERVIELVWGTDFAVGRRNLHTHVKRLRQRIERDPTDPRYIVTIRGFGYRFNTPKQQGQPA